MIKLLWIGLLVLFLTSCASVSSLQPSPSSTPSKTWASRSAQLSHISSWQVNGKVAVQTAQDSGSASVDWQQQRNNYSISLTGPLGSAGLKINGSPGRATLQTSDGKRFTAANAEQLLAQNWGFDLPVSYLRYWVRGLPVSGVAATTQFDAYHRLASLQQAGWTIQFQNYTNSNGIELPERITATSRTMKVKMIIYRWQVGNV